MLLGQESSYKTSRNMKRLPEFEACFDDSDGEESLLNVDVVGSKQQQTCERVRSELNVNNELSLRLRRPWKRYEPARRKLGIANHRVYKCISL